MPKLLIEIEPTTRVETQGGCPVRVWQGVVVEAGRIEDGREIPVGRKLELLVAQVCDQGDLDVLLVEERERCAREVSEIVDERVRYALRPSLN